MVIQRAVFYYTYKYELYFARCPINLELLNK